MNNKHFDADTCFSIFWQNERGETNLAAIKAIVFDAYGTLFDVHTVVEKCEKYFPTKGRMISEIWRQKQLEYTWLRSLMGRYEDFWRVTEDALTFALKQLGLETTMDVRTDILHTYLSLKPYREVPDLLKQLSRAYTLAILSNGSPNMLHAVIQNAELSDCFSYVISVDERKTFKPSMEVYQLAPAKLGIPKEETLFVSSNSWDAAGAKVFGFQVCWLNRFHQTFDELDSRPDFIVNDLEELADHLT